jgi:SAM-dependent methyltransferase
VSTLSQHHWPDRAAGFRDLARVLRPGATLWVYDIRRELDVAAARSAFPAATVTIDRIPGLAGLLIRRLTVRT